MEIGLVQVLTPTGARLEAFKLTVQWMLNQDYKGKVRWIIVDDGPEPVDIPDIHGWEVVYIRRRPFWRPGQNTQMLNLSEGLKMVRRELPLIHVEDDEHYADGWISECAEALKENTLHGQRLMRKYNIKHNRYQEGEFPHSSLSCTAMIGDATRRFAEYVKSGIKIIDGPLWREFANHSSQTMDHFVTGIKQLPGREGIDSCQRDSMVGESDPDGLILEKWIGKEASLLYRSIQQ